ncbi:peptidase M48-like protein [Algoriphagus boseongensis]|uniref:Peptidase M48-like protein n=1 Tax=Algoriphagus boseongensis TaxID=1442587 RepID=A0A4R6T7E2_9BACT|nr:M48 family metallopeptidase [Algoriphagus boseongensis]TDQ18930.1 peptidase M48-like protein [Algoriphagus boseongensis]
MKKILSFLFLGLVVYACAKVPLTGRMQLAAVPNEEIMPLVNEQYQTFKKDSKLLSNTPDGQKVVRVGERISKAVEEFLVKEGYQDLVKSFKWEFNLAESDQVNAWCMPGGKVAFYTAIMPVCQDENGIAVVMGHEVAHAVASHARERMSNGMLANLGISAVSVAIGQNPTLTQQIFLQSVGIGSELGMLSFSRKHELEADELGLIFMAMAGYDPRTAPAFWERMAKVGGEAPPEFLSTHPGPDRRIEKLNANMAKAMEYYNAAK